MLDQSGATVKEAMQLARHGDPKLTLARYGRMQLHDLSAAVERLPSLVSGPQEQTAVRMQATRTEEHLPSAQELTSKLTSRPESRSVSLTPGETAAPSDDVDATLFQDGSCAA